MHILPIERTFLHNELTVTVRRLRGGRARLVSADCGQFSHSESVDSVRWRCDQDGRQWMRGFLLRAELAHLASKEAEVLRRMDARIHPFCLRVRRILDAAA